MATDGRDAEVDPAEHDPVARMVAETFEAGPVHCDDLRPVAPRVPGPASGAVEENQAPNPMRHDVGPVGGHTEGEGGTHRVANDDDRPQVEGFDHDGDVVDQAAKVEAVGHRRRLSEATEVGGDHVVAAGGQRPGQQREGAEARAVPVQQQQGWPLPELLDVQVAAVRRRKVPCALGREGEGCISVRVGSTVEPHQDEPLDGPDGSEANRGCSQRRRPSRCGHGSVLPSARYQLLDRCAPGCVRFDLTVPPDRLGGVLEPRPGHSRPREGQPRGVERRRIASSEHGSVEFRVVAGACRGGPIEGGRIGHGSDEG
jgi:hypothetical protein